MVEEEESVNGEGTRRYRGMRKKKMQRKEEEEDVDEEENADEEEDVDEAKKKQQPRWRCVNGRRKKKVFGFVCKNFRFFGNIV